MSLILHAQPNSVEIKTYAHLATVLLGRFQIPFSEFCQHLRFIVEYLDLYSQWPPTKAMARSAGDECIVYTCHNLIHFVNNEPPPQEVDKNFILSSLDFYELFHYFLTNSNLMPDDPRLDLWHWLRSLSLEPTGNPKVMFLKNVRAGILTTGWFSQNPHEQRIEFSSEGDDHDRPQPLT